MKPFFVYTCWLLLLALPLTVWAQPSRADLVGIWKGELYVDSTKLYHPYELSVSEEKGKLIGWSRIRFEQKGIMQSVIRDHTIEINGESIIITDDEQLGRGSSILQLKEVRKKMIVSVQSRDSQWVMQGTWSTNRTRVFLAATGSVQLTKEKDFRQSELYKKLDSLAIASRLSYVPSEQAGTSAAAPLMQEQERYLMKRSNTFMASSLPYKKAATAPRTVQAPKPVKPKTLYFAVKDKPQAPVAAAPAPAPTTAAPVAVVAASKPVKPARNNTSLNPGIGASEYANRSNKTQQEVFFRSDSLQITLYDNGEIDGDTVSVLMNGKLIIAKQGLSTKQNVHSIYIDQDTPDPIQLVMYAENLGSIPPNTGLLVVRDGSAVYEVRFSADLSTNAAIILRRKE